MKKTGKQPGTIATFYSYKGGVGRSMALANVAVLLANWGYRTLMIDWDLEAPGLENFFKTYISIAAARDKPGLIDVLGSEMNTGGTKIQWQDCLMPIPIKNDDTAVLIRDKLFMITSGRVDDGYYKKVRNFDFNDFYSNYNGGNIIERFRTEWKKAFDFILIDSRTGVTDTGGVCTIQLPDLLVLLFTPTDQGFDGIRRIAAKVAEGRLTLPDDRMELPALPVPTRMDSAESAPHALWLRKFADGLDAIYKPWIPKGLNNYELLVQTKVPYSSLFSFGEGLPVADEGVKDPVRMGYAYQGLAALVAKQLNNADIFLNNRQDFIYSAMNPDINLDHDDVKNSYISAERNVKLKEVQLDDSLNEIENNKRKQRRTTQLAIGGAVVSILIAFGIYFFQAGAKVDPAVLTQHIKDSILKVQAKQFDSLRSASKKTDSLPVFNAIKELGKPIGMDISRFNQVNDWSKVKRVGISFVLIKATEGSDHTDSTFAKNWEQAEANLMIRGAYHYFTNRASVSVQAANFIKSVHLTAGDLPPVLDLDAGNAKTKLDDVIYLLDALESHYHIRPIIYAPYTFAKVLAQDKRFLSYSLWVGVYGPNNNPRPKSLLLSPKWPDGWKTWTFWQFTTEGEIDGVTNTGGVKIDLDQFNGSEGDLQNLTIPSIKK